MAQNLPNNNVKAALYARVSTERQDAENQLAQLRDWAARRQLDVACEYAVEESGFRGAHLKALTEIYEDARKGKFGVLLVWSLDRLSRQGALATLEIVHRLGDQGVQVWSMQESWTEASGEMRDLLLAIVGFVARTESQRLSERIKAGMAIRRKAGLQVGRRPIMPRVRRNPDYARIMRATASLQMSHAEAAERLGISRRTLLRELVNLAGQKDGGGPSEAAGV